MNLKDVFQSNYLKAGDLNGKDVTMTITGAKVEQLGQGAAAQTKLVLSIHNTDKRFVLNKTNAKTIEKLYGSETDEWIGKKIVVGPREVEYQGSMTMSLRVIPKMPAGAAKPAVQPASDDLGWGPPEDGEEVGF